MPDYPPYPYLIQIAQNCPKACFTYMKLWELKDENHVCNVSKEDIRSEFLLSTAKFRHDILMLAKEALVNVDESPNIMRIELVRFDLDAEGFTLC